VTRPPRSRDTEAVHGGDFRDDSGGSHTPPVERTSVFEFRDAEAMEAAFRGERNAWIYTRYGNPTLDLVERHIARLEGGDAALALSSGMAAISTALLSVLSSGDELVSAADLYGGTRNLFEGPFRRFGIATRYFPVEDAEAARHLLTPRTRALFVETPTNPTLKVADLEALGRVARDAGVPLVVDNTFATPYLQRPLSLGADFVIHSATKALAGHDDVTAGLVVGSRAAVDAARETMKWMGGCLDPDAAWLLERGLKTLAVRLERQCANAQALAEWLGGAPGVAAVHYPGLPDHPAHALARRQMTGFGGILAFEVDGGLDSARRVANGLRLVRLAPTLGGVATIALLPALSSHIRMSPEERRAVGIGDGLIRLSCGLESAADLIADLDEALRA
jgi:methionine-gamma-lyase